jgi:uncharacterized membrane protein YtjA (UPF0391 family)
MKRTLSALLPAIGLIAAFGFSGAAPAQAAGCSRSDVTVLVQFPDHTTIGCAPGNPGTGYDALKAAGFPITYATGSGTGAICSIGGFPAHPCPSMPAANAYWAYFHARPGGGSYDPAPGSVEGWRFGGGGAPTTPPPALAVTPPTPKATPPKAPSRQPSRQPSTQPTQKPTGAVTDRVTPTAPGATAGVTPTVTPSATATASDGSVVAPTTSASSTAAAAKASSTSSADSSSGGLSWIWAPVLFGFLGVAGAATYSARRRG